MNKHYVKNGYGFDIPEWYGQNEMSRWVTTGAIRQLAAAIAGMEDDPGPSPEHVAAVNEQVRREAAAERDVD